MGLQHRGAPSTDIQVEELGEGKVRYTLMISLSIYLVISTLLDGYGFVANRKSCKSKVVIQPQIQISSQKI